MEYKSNLPLNINTFTNTLLVQNIETTNEEQYIDSLTNSFNEVYFHNNIEKIIAKNKLRGFETGFLYFSIDNLKEIVKNNDQTIIDSVLQDISLVCVSLKDKQDFFFRIMEDSFLLVSQVSNELELFTISENIRKHILNTFFDTNEKITCSFGGTLVMENLTIEENLIKAINMFNLSQTQGNNRTNVLDNSPF